MVAKSKSIRKTTIQADFDVTVDVEIGIEEIERWLNSATEKEIARLDLGNLRLNCGDDAGSLHDLDGIQAILDTMDVSEVLRKLAA